MVDRDYLSEFEQLVMLAVLQLGDEAYGTRLRKVLATSARRNVSIATIYVALGRLERRGLVRSGHSAPTAVRGGRSRRLFHVEPAGLEALARARDTFDQMWREAQAVTAKGRRR